MDDLWVVLPHLGAGGAQKVGLLAAEHFASQGLRVRVLSLRHGHPIKHALPAEVDVFDLGPDEAALHPLDRGPAHWGRPAGAHKCVQH